MSRVDKKAKAEESSAAEESAPVGKAAAMAIPEDVQAYMRQVIAGGVKSVAPDTLRCLEPYGWQGQTSDEELRPWLEGLVG